MMKIMGLFLCVLAVLVANYFLRFDADDRAKGAPHRPLWAKAAYPKSYVHALTAFSLMLLFMLAAAPWVLAAAAVFVLLLGWEWTSGYIDWLDVAANAAGIVGAVLAVLVFGA